MTPVLEIANLSVEYAESSKHTRVALRNLNLQLRAGEIAAILGESGSGKSTLALAILRLLPANGRIVTGSIRFGGNDLCTLTPREMEHVRGARIALVFQEPATALHPTMRAGEQVAQVIQVHDRCNRQTRRERALAALRHVFSEDVERIYSSYPHQLSGGQKQRVLIAQAIACRPKLLIADEPTSSLDPETQAEVIRTLARLRDELGIAILLITHNPALLSGFADRLIVLYGGQIVEDGPCDELSQSPRHPYLQRLLGCMPGSPLQALENAKLPLPTIPGAPSTIDLSLHACCFEPLCGERMPECAQIEPELVAIGASASVACFKYNR